MINTATEDRENNSEFDDEPEPYATIKAKTTIRNGDEVLLDYGQAYQVSEPNVVHKTTTRPARRQLHPKLGMRRVRSI
jgi:hypothetical protein